MPRICDDCKNEVQRREKRMLRQRREKRMLRISAGLIGAWFVAIVAINIVVGHSCAR